MNDVQETIKSLREKVWTLVAIGDELEVSLRAVAYWQSGDRYPENAKGVKRLLDDLVIQTDIPQDKRKRQSTPVN